VSDLRRRPHGPQRIVLVQGGDAEDGHGCIADELLDRPAVALHDLLDRREVAAHQRSQRFGVELLAESGAAGNVGE
jgi:hypothetical protein